MSDGFYSCSCFLDRNYFIKTLRLHVTFCGEQQFREEYQQVLKNCSAEDVDNILRELSDERTRRAEQEKASRVRQRQISEDYKPLHPHIYRLQESFLAPEYLTLISYCKSADAKVEGVLSRIKQQKGVRLYSLPVFTPTFCELLLEELSHFEETELPKGRPNTMNNYGILLNELGLDEGLISPLREHYLTPLTALLFPDWGGHQLDSHKAFTVHYKMDQDLDLNYHYDNSEITLNVSLGKDFDEGSLYFGPMRTDVPVNKDSVQFVECTHKVADGLLHRGQHLHGALPIADGERHNLIIWLRSSAVRNKLCPMCDRIPDLRAAHGFGDGFTQESVNVCNLV